MKVYRMKFHSPQLWYITQWFGTQGEAAAMLASLQNERQSNPFVLYGDAVTELEFPGTDLAAALSFLNTNCGTLGFKRPGYWTAILPPEG